MAAKKTVLVTGASQGLGAEIAVAFAREGYEVAVSSTALPRLATVISRIEASGARAVGVELEVRSQASIAAAVAAAVAGLGQIDVLINNAAVALKKPALEVAPEEWDTVLDTNLAGAFFVTQQVGRHLVATRRPGSVVSIASTHGLVSMELRTTYGIAKAGVIHMTRTLAYEWAEHGIRVNAIAPGRVNTPSRELTVADAPMREKLLARVPLGRFAESEEVAAAACYLASPAATYITGHTLVMDGGLTVY